MVRLETGGWALNLQSGGATSGSAGTSVAKGRQARGVASFGNEQHAPGLSGSHCHLKHSLSMCQNEAEHSRTTEAGAGGAT